MRVPIPAENDGEWQCYQIYWPPGLDWLAILRGLITMPMRGRYWDERTGSILAAQSIAWEIFNRNIALNACETSPGGNTTIIREIITAFEDAGEGEDNMSVQKVWIDCTTGELVVDYGGCSGECRFDLSCIAADTGPDAPISPDPSGDGPFYACGKAYFAVRTVFQFAESLFTHCDDFLDLTPWGEIKAENPGVEYNLATAYLARAKALEIKGLFAGEWTDVSDLEQSIRCAVLSLFTATDDDDLADSDNWASFKTAFASGMDWRFWDFFVLVCNALGQAQLGQIALDHALDNTQDCGCPEPPDPELPEGYNWVYSLDFTTSLHQWTLTGDGGEIQDGTGIYDSTPGGEPWNYVSFQCKRDPENADATTVLKYAKVWFTAGAHWNRDGNADFLQFTGSTPATRILPMTLIAEDYEGGAAARLWTSEVGVVLGPSNGEFLKMNIGGYDNNPITTTLKITKLVIAGDGALPFPLI